MGWRWNVTPWGQVLALLNPNYMTLIYLIPLSLFLHLKCGNNNSHLAELLGVKIIYVIDKNQHVLITMNTSSIWFTLDKYLNKLLFQ